MDTKKCNKCNEIKDEIEFSFKNKEKCLRATICNKCQREYKNKWYHNHSGNKERFRKNRAKTKEILRNKMIEFLSDKQCIDCGEDNYVTFEFDHKDTNDKKMEISKMIGHCYSWYKIEEEIKKCDIRCANCHRIKTAKQFGYYRILKSQ